MRAFCLGPDDGQALTQTPPNIFKKMLKSLASKHLFVYCFSMPKEFQLYAVFQSDNLEKSDWKSILS